MAALKEELEVDAAMTPGSSGQFEVFVEGRSVIRKTMTDFPTEQEVVDAVARALGR